MTRNDSTGGQFVSAGFGSTYPVSGYSTIAGFWTELILTIGLVSVFLGIASGAPNIGIVGAFGVGGYIALVARPIASATAAAVTGVVPHRLQQYLAPSAELGIPFEGGIRSALRSRSTGQMAPHLA